MCDMPRSSFLTASLLRNIYHRQKFDVNCFLTIYLCVTKVGADIYHVGRLIFSVSWASDDAPGLCAHMFSLFDDSDTIDEYRCGDPVVLAPQPSSRAPEVADQQTHGDDLGE